MFFQIKNERFKMTSVTRYSSPLERSVHTSKYYISVRFGAAERLFAFDTREECEATLKYLDTVFKVQVI